MWSTMDVLTALSITAKVCLEYQLLQVVIGDMLTKLDMKILYKYRWGVLKQAAHNFKCATDSLSGL